MIKALAIILGLIGQPDSIPVYELPEVVVTATRLSLPADASPWPVEVLEAEEAQVTDLTDVLSQSVSADVRSYGYEGHSAFPFLGGASSSRVLILYNGIHMNSRRDGVIDLSLIPLAPGDRVEVVKGPLSALYGSAAIGGVLNVIPSKKN
jgi:vitamin B12 transporter